ncbi:hypothetical protein BC829DRAFT_443096 [Chytridium lagenaria]|nr:hypothetical protein BC829DRAFT_443096 [Chytridium lagenaria]
MSASRYPNISLTSYLRKYYSLQVLVVAVGVGCGAGVFMMQNVLRRDPTIVMFNRKENPYPWLSVGQADNLKLYAVAQKFDASSDKGFKA